MHAKQEDRTRGLSGRQILAILIILAAQLIVIIAVLQLMLKSSSEGAGMEFPDIPTVIKVPFGGEPSTPRVLLDDNSEKKGCVEGRTGAKMEESFEEMVMVGGHMDASQYLVSMKQRVAKRLACHSTFVSDRKYALVMVLWEAIEGVYELEELAEVAASSSSMDGATASAASGTSREEVEVVGFRKEVEERMGKSDFEGVLKMVKSGLNRAGGKFGKGKVKIEGGYRSKGKEHFDEKMKMVEDSTRKVKRGLSASWEILHEIEEEMKEMEGWLRWVEGVLAEIVAEFLEGL
ncbi:hypothetical protein DID88_003371 [Monilinia fructigena]|uniref:Uncharacterized protein n=1 Tax=Monilinia fructigena TaxID=38457 RepID=A0A395IV38_9HELO|nr:hypothetical protein DID88_003371 [Monilinia fructigena]